MVGNKLDLDSERQISTSEGQSYANETNLLFSETSARTGEHVGEAFIKIAKKLPKTDQHLASPRLAAASDTRRRIDFGRGAERDSSTVNRCC